MLLKSLSRLDGDLITVRMRHYDEPTHGDSNKKPPEGGFIVSRGV